MRKYDIVSSALVFLAGLALLFVIIPVFVPTILDGDYGLLADSLPNVAAIAITFLAGAFFLYRLRKPAADGDDEAPVFRDNWMFLLRGAVFLIVLTLLMEYAGFLAAGPVLVAGFMLMMGERRYPLIALTAIGAPVLVWLFFVKLLVYPLP